MQRVTEELQQLGLDSQPKHSNLYVNSLPPSVHDEHTLRALFAPYGVIDSLRLVKTSRLGGGKAFAFVKYKTVAEAQNAIAALNQAQIGNSVLEVKLADADAGDRNPELCAPPSDNLYCKNLPGTYTEEELRALFKPFGSVMECRVLHSGPGRDNAQGAGALVRMNSVDEASKAIAHLHNQRLQGTTIPLVVRYADSQEQKAKKAARQHKQAPNRYGSYHDIGIQGYSHQDLQGMHMPMVNSGLVYSGDPAYLAADQGMMGMMGGYASHGGPCSIYIKYLPEEVRTKHEVSRKFGRMMSLVMVYTCQALAALTVLQ